MLIILSSFREKCVLFYFVPGDTCLSETEIPTKIKMIYWLKDPTTALKYYKTICTWSMHASISKSETIWFALFEKNIKSPQWGFFQTCVVGFFSLNSFILITKLLFLSFLWLQDRWHSPKSLPQTSSDGANKKKKPESELVVHIVRAAKYHHKAVITLQHAWWLNILKHKCQGHGVSRMLLTGAHVLCWVVLCSAWWSCFCLLWQH